MKRWGGCATAGASGQLTVRADSGFYTHSVVSACRRMDVRFSITIRQHASLRDLIEAIPEEDWTPIPYWMDGARRCRRDDLHSLPDQAGRRAGAAHCPAGEARRPVPNWPSSPNTAITASSPTGTERPWNWRLVIAATPRSRTPFETSSTASV